MPYTIEHRGDEYIVRKESGGPALGHHDSRASAERQVAAIHANEGKAMPQKNRTVKIFGLPNPFAKPKAPNLGPAGSTGIPPTIRGQLESAFSDLLAARSTVISLVREMSQDPDLDPDTLRTRANHAYDLNLAKQFVGSMRDATTLQDEVLPKISNMVARMSQVAQEIRNTLEMKSTDAFRKQYLAARVKAATLKLLSPDPTVGKLIDAMDYLDRAAETVARVASNEYIPENVRAKLTPKIQTIKQLAGQMDGLRGRLRVLKLFDNTGSALGNQLWNKPKLR